MYGDQLLPPFSEILFSPRSAMAASVQKDESRRPTLTTTPLVDQEPTPACETHQVLSWSE
jgi:hypothetical protein